LGQLRRVRPAQLQRHRMLDRIKAQQAVAVAVDHRRRRDHLRIEQGARAQRTVKRPTVAVGPIHHGCHGQSMSLIYRHFLVRSKSWKVACALEFATCCDVFSGFSTPQCTQSAHEMATYSKLPSGTWRVQVRRKGRYISKTFLKRDDARRWATEAEGRIDRGEVPSPSRSARLRTFGELIDLHIEDMKSVGKAPRRSKAATLKMLKTRLG